MANYYTILLSVLLSVALVPTQSWGLVTKTPLVAQPADGMLWQIAPWRCSQRAGVTLYQASMSMASTEEDTDCGIMVAEEALRQAMLNSDVARLDDLLSDDLVFTNHMGMKMGKQDDLDAHRAGLVSTETIELSDHQVTRLTADVGTVTVAAHLVGSFGGEPFEDTLRFTRVWKKVENKWSLVTAHASAEG